MWCGPNWDTEQKEGRAVVSRGARVPGRRRRRVADVVGAVSGHATVPQVFINGSLIDGSEELQAYFGDADAA
jgi:glutaredoxin